MIYLDDRFFRVMSQYAVKSTLIYCLLACFFISSATANESNQLKKRSLGQGSKESEILLMARHIKNSDQPTQRDFVLIILNTMQQVYSQELDKVTTQSQRTNKKLFRWSQSTQRYIRYINAAQSAVESGERFVISITREARLLINVANNQAVLISGPQETDSGISAQVKQTYCLYYNCDWLQTSESNLNHKLVADKKGVWLFGQRQPPTYEVEQKFKFVFNNLVNKKAKQAIARQVVQESQHFLDVLKKTQLAGYRIDWTNLFKRRSKVDVERQISLNSQQVYLKADPSALDYLTLKDWQRLIVWLRRSLQQDHQHLKILEAEALLINESIN
ncbi:MAG: hypothetical protein KBT50_02005 [Cycloclasticus sp.]|nr:hypothetical protein [Cycloclasticus sp.]MBQ0789363.1 hypothetical protein [Cycloclasticus sp.]